MKMEDYIAPLIRAALDSDIKTIRAISIKAVRNLKNTHPEISEQISEALNYHSSGLPAARSIGYESSPQDAETKNDLLRVVEPIKIECPIFSKDISNVVQQIIDERNNISRLMAEGLSPISSVLLYGEPGVGKTLLAQYLAGEFEMKFATLDMATAVSSYLGKTGSNLKKVFDYAKNEPTVLLLDEFDAIAKRRDDLSDLGELKRVVNVLLKELEEWPAQSIVIAATNHPELLDKAIWRRFEVTIKIPLPNQDIRRLIIENCFANTTHIKKIEKISGVLAELMDRMSPADIQRLCDRAKKQSILYDKPIERELILLVANEKDEKDVEFNRRFCQIAKKELKMPYREMAELLGKSVSAIQNYLKKGV